MNTKKLSPQSIQSMLDAQSSVRLQIDALHKTAKAVFPVGATLHFVRLRQMSNYSGRVSRVCMDGHTPQIWLCNRKTGNTQCFYFFEVVNAYNAGQVSIEMPEGAQA